MLRPHTPRTHCTALVLALIRASPALPRAGNRSLCIWSTQARVLVLAGNGESAKTDTADNYPANLTNQAQTHRSEYTWRRRRRRSDKHAPHFSVRERASERCDLSTWACYQRIFVRASIANGRRLSRRAPLRAQPAHASSVRSDPWSIASHLPAGHKASPHRHRFRSSPHRNHPSNAERTTHLC